MTHSAETHASAGRRICFHFACLMALWLAGLGIPVGADASDADARPGVSTPAPPLRPGLEIKVTVLVAGRKEVEELVRVSHEGAISLPLVGSCQVSGLTLEGIARQLTGQYAEFFVSPQVIVEFDVDSRPDAVSPWGYVLVMGRVKNPGRVRIPPTQDLTLSAAIQASGGLDTSAKDSAVRLTRVLPSGQTTQMEMNLKAIGLQGALTNDVPLQPGDVVYVPELIF